MAEQECPYPGLHCFEADNAHFFFGRERELQRLGELLKHQTFVAVIGHQEVGKSSFIRAGLKKKPIRIQDKEDVENGEYLLFCPGPRPLESLALAIAAELEAESGGIRDKVSITRDLEIGFKERDFTLNDTIAFHFQQYKLPKLIIIDQFEEIFYLAHRDRDVFVDLIVDAIAHHNETVRIVIALRWDFIQECFAYPRLVRLLLELAHVFLDDLSGTSLRDAIVQPSQSVGLEFEEGLVQQIQKEAQECGASISSVQLLLFELWNRRRNGLMTWEAYHQLGGVTDLISRIADEFFTRLTDKGKQLCLNILSRLIVIQNGVVAKRRAYRSECYPKEIAAATVHTTIFQLTLSQLIKENENGYLEITSESLLRWNPLNEWLHKNWAWLEFHQRLREFAKAWEDSSQDPLLLYRGALLQELKSWAQQQPTDFSFELFRSDRTFFSEKNRMKMHTNQWVWTMLSDLERLAGARSRGQTIATEGQQPSQWRCLTKLLRGMYSQPFVYKALSWGAIRRSACILAENTYRKSQPIMLNALEQRFVDASLAQHGQRRGKKGIFVNYRRSDTIQIAHRLADSLCKVFGTTNIFIDEDSIPSGVDFREHIYRSIDQCAVLLIVIGDRWLEAKDDRGQVRLNNPDDYVRVEIELSLRLGLTVIPILIDEAEIPAASELSSSIKQLSYLNVFKLHSGRSFRNDLDNLATQLRQIIGRRYWWNPFK
jgi:hypothetical protein